MTAPRAIARFRNINELQLFAISTIATFCVLYSIFWALSSWYFGSSRLNFALFLGSVFFLVAAGLGGAGLFSRRNPFTRIDEAGPAWVAGVILGIGMNLVAVSSTDLIWTSFVAGDANRVIASRTAVLGRPPVIAEQVALATRDKNSVLRNESFLREIIDANGNQEKLVDFIVAAKALGVDARFVQDNALVRQKDKDSLFRAAISRADEGDAIALAWLQGHGGSRAAR